MADATDTEMRTICETLRWYETCLLENDQMDVDGEAEATSSRRESRVGQRCWAKASSDEETTGSNSVAEFKGMC